MFAAARESQVGGSRIESLAAVRGRATLPAFPISGNPCRAGDLEGGAPCAVEHELHRIGGGGPGARNEGEVGVDPLTQDRGRLPGLLPARGRDLHVQRVDEDPTVTLVLEPREQRAQDPEGRGHHPACVSRVDAFAQHLDLERPAREAAQRGRAPQPLVVSATGVETHHEARGANARAQRLDVVGQVVAPALLARLDDHHAARVRDPLLVQRTERGERGVDRVTVVRASAPVEPIAFQLRPPGTEPVAPAAHFGLFVEMPVEQEAVVALARNFDEDERGAPRQADDFELHSRHRVLLAPAHHVRDRLLHVSVFRPVRVEVGRLVGDADVLGELRDDGVVPECLHVAADTFGVHGRSSVLHRKMGRRAPRKAKPTSRNTR